MQFQLNPGIYNIEDPSLPPPSPVNSFAVELDEENNRLLLSWGNDNNALVDHYEIELCNDGGDNKYFTTESRLLEITEPLVEPGKRYTFRVRAIGRGGAGRWSEKKTIYFRTAVPTKPQKPKIVVESTKEIIVSVPRPSEQECNGAHVSHCIVDCRSVDGNSTEWESLACPILQQSSHEEDSIELRIEGLEEDTSYDVRVKFRNAAGDSQPSETVRTQTNEPKPGMPLNFRVSTKRTANMIKLRWSQPDRFACRYELQMRTRRGNWSRVLYSERLSAKATDLNQDTKYYFRVRAVNRSGYWSNFTEEINAETRFSNLSKAALAPLVFIGGSLASPIILGGLGLASEIVDSDRETLLEQADGLTDGIFLGVAGLILGIPAAPFVGGFLTHKFVNWGDDYSDQSDDD